MREIINQILEGNVDYENGSLDFSCSKIELSLQKGESFEGSFSIYSETNSYINGFVTSSDCRMECITAEFTGNESLISYCFHGEYLEEGDTVKGVFSVVCNQGEYYLPFAVTIEHQVLDSSMGAVKNLFHFANLAKSNWQEAVNLFYAPEFETVFTGVDAQHLNSYRALAVNPGNEQNMEEFLIQIHKKQKVEFITEEENVIIETGSGDGVYSVLERKIELIRNGWGYTSLQVECDGDFLYTEKMMLTDDDFLGNHCRLPIYVDTALCREGKNFGRISLHNSYVSLTIPVTVRVGEKNVLQQNRISAKRSIVQLMEFYQAFRMKKITTSTWLNETTKLVDKLVAMEEENIAFRLFKAQLLITEERYNEASWLLDHVEDMLEREGRDRQSKEELWAYYWYLTTLIRREEEYVNQVASQVEQIYKRERYSWRVAWLLIYLSEEYSKSPSARWHFLEKQFENGCTSFFLYMEALNMVNINPTLLRKLEGFELQVVCYGIRQELLSLEATEQFLYLVGRTKEYSELLFKTLKKLYSKKKDPRILQEIITMLIKGGKSGEAYLAWYEAGVKAQLRITNLYEYFMMSLSLEKLTVIPKMVLLYFSYQNNMDYSHSAYLYDYVVQNREKLGDLYDTYRPRIEYFVREQILREHIDRHLANLYKFFLTPEMVDDELAHPLSRLLFAHYLKVEEEQLKKVFVYHSGCIYPTEYSLNDGVTWVALYGSDYVIAFEDAYGNRFVKNVEYTLEKLMIPGRLTKTVLQYADCSPELDLCMMESEREATGTEDEILARQMRLAMSTAVCTNIRHGISVKLLQLLYDRDELEALDEHLEYLANEDLEVADRSTVFKYLVLRGQYDTAIAWVERFGPYYMEITSLVRVVGEMIRRCQMVETKAVTAAALFVFQKGKYDNQILQYLAAYYQGMTKDLRDLWKAERAFDMDAYELSERMLIQMLYTRAFVGEWLDIYQYYVSCGGKMEVEAAFLTQCAYDYFAKEKVTDNYIYNRIMRLYRSGEQLHRICRLACLKYYAENQEECDEEMKRFLKRSLEKLINAGVHLNFFREYKEFQELLQEMGDKTIIEYRVRPGAKAKIYYVMLHDNGEAEEYLSEYMWDVAGGVCMKEFVLFFGETLQYYIMEEADGQEQLTESGTVQMSDIRNTVDTSRYGLINDMVISKTLQDYDTLDGLLEEYYRKDYYNERLFRLI